MARMVLEEDSTIESLTPSVNAPQGPVRARAS
jgi:hypothetical protein